MGETRKIAAILVADVVGYSRLAGADEDRTLSRLRGLRSDLIDPAIAAHHGAAAARRTPTRPCHRQSGSAPLCPRRVRQTGRRIAWSGSLQRHSPTCSHKRLPSRVPPYRLRRLAQPGAARPMTIMMAALVGFSEPLLRPRRSALGSLPPFDADERFPRERSNEIVCC